MPDQRGLPGDAKFPLTPAATAGATASMPIIDPRIAGLYGVTDPDVAWTLMPGHRPQIHPLDEVHVRFAAGTTPEQVQAFAAAVGATLLRIGFSPVGDPPAAAAFAQLRFDPWPSDMAAFAAPPARGDQAPDVVSSERALRIVYAVQRARTQQAAFGVLSMALNMRFCSPEDCSVDPADPYAQAGPGGTLPATPPPVYVSPVDLGLARDGARLFKLGPEVFRELPDGARTLVLRVDPYTDVLAVDPRLRFVIASVFIPEPQPPGTPTGPARPRLVLIPVDTGDHRELRPPDPGLIPRVSLSPDGRWLALPMRPASGAPGLLGFDLVVPGTAPATWLAGHDIGKMSWSPAGDRLLVERFAPASSDPASTHVVVDPASSRVTPLPPGTREPRWRPDGKLECDGDAVDQPVACEAVP